MIFPGSALFNRAKQWIVAAEMVETSRLFARFAANIDSTWLEDIGHEQCTYTYMNPLWERNRGEVVAFEQVSLYGLMITSDRQKSYGRINPEEASDIFIQDALISGDVEEMFDFLNHNMNLIDEIRDLENRIRRKDLLVNEQDLFRF